ncbi:MAG: class I SAM-dependent methyltransferase [Flavobacteriaceae bacterium]|nr:class I SAM-dependent methyltransferase [Flavobacteriaceae bacterium]
MLQKVTRYLVRFLRKKEQAKKELDMRTERENYLSGGRIPWSQGYVRYKEEFIKESLHNDNVLTSFKNPEGLVDFGQGLDERAVEYPWIFSNLPEAECRLLDAGSTFNFDFIVNHPVIVNKDLTIYTFDPERSCFFKNRISYIYGDLRDMYLKNESFDFVVSQSTIEHIDMDNSMYGYELEFNQNIDKKSYEYLSAVQEMLRTLKPGGTLLITFPYGKFENHGFFQQFDGEMLDRIVKLFENLGACNITFFKYEKSGWRFAAQEEVNFAESFNPHTGKGKKDGFAAHSRAIACIKFVKFK